MAEDESHGLDSQDPVPPDAAVGQPTETVAANSPVRIPKQIGHFHVKRVIASGGMGTVYEAIQEKPRRTVALKVMKHGIASRSALRRFEYESQILARLHHPGIAQVYEAGTHDDGDGPVPYFAMEYVPSARPVTQYATEKKLVARERLKLFARVCDAVHHGHQKGIIHRDLKPGNILVDSAGEVKIIDFGVARGTDSDLAVTTLQTDVGQLIGTLQYMSPEQCEADPHNIDTRSDVYALGVILYELLVDRLPYDVSQKPLFETTRTIREQQPARLSTANAALRGDVETIVLKALEKDRERRYQSADEFRRDVEHQLRGEPISARSPSVAYQLRVFARRNKRLVAAVAVVFAVLALGVVGTSIGLVQANRQRVAAEQAQADARREADNTKAINEFFKDMIGAANPFTPGSMPLRAPATEATVRELLLNATARVEQHFADRPKLEAEMRATLSSALFSLGRYDEAEAQGRLALDIRRRELGEVHRDTLQSMRELSAIASHQGRATEAVALIRGVYEGHLRGLGPDDPTTRNAASWLATMLGPVGGYREAETLLRGLLELPEGAGDDELQNVVWSMGTLAGVLTDQGKLQEGESLARRAQELGSTGSDGIAVLFAKMKLAIALCEQGRYAEAEAAQQAVVRGFEQLFGQNHPFVPALTGLLASILAEKGELNEAETMLREVFQTQQRELGHHHSYTLTTLLELVDVLNAREEFEEAELLARDIIPFLRREFGKEGVDRLRALNGLALALCGLGRLEEAEVAFREVVETSEHVYTSGFCYLPVFQAHFGRCLTDLNRFEEAERQLLAAYAGEMAMRGEQHKNTRQVVANLVHLYETWDKPDEAAEWRANFPTTNPVRRSGG